MGSAATGCPVQHVVPSDVTAGTVVTSAGARTYRALRMRKRKDLRVLRGKHDTVYLSEAADGAFFDAMAELDTWLQRRRELGFGDERPLFCWASGAPVRVSELRDVVKGLMRSIGLDPARFGAHSLRIGVGSAARQQRWRLACRRR